MSGEKQFQFKVYFDARDSIRRCSFQKNLPTFAEFLACCRELFTDEFTGGERYRFAYLDDENDWIAIASEMEWQAMLSFFFPKVDDKPQPIKIYVKRAPQLDLSRSVKLGESFIDTTDVDIDELDKLAQSYRPSGSAAAKAPAAAPSISSQPASSAGPDDVKKMLEASALEYEHEQERQLQKALLDSRKEAERRDAEAKEQAALAKMVAEKAKQQKELEERKLKDESERLAKEQQRQEEIRKEAERVAAEQQKEEERLQKLRKEEEEKKQAALDALKKKQEEEKKAQEIRERIMKMKEEFEKKKKDEEEKKRQEEEKRRREEEARKLKEEEERKRKEAEEAQRKEAEKKAAEEREQRLKVESDPRVEKYQDQLFQLRELGFNQDLLLLLGLLDENNGDIIPVVERLVVL